MEDEVSAHSPGAVRPVGEGIRSYNAAHVSVEPPLATGNRMLDALSGVVREKILGLCTPVRLPVGTVLHGPAQAPRYADFVSSGVVSSVVSVADGRFAEVGIVGREGVVGASHVLGQTPGPTRSTVQLEVTALRMRFEDFAMVFRRSEKMRDLVLEFVQQQETTLAQLAACNRLHGAERRLARWLLMRRDRTDSDVIPITHELLALVMGTRRPAVTLCAARLKRQGLIDGRRGAIRILHPEGLEAAACDCYRVTRTALDGLYR